MSNTDDDTLLRNFMDEHIPMDELFDVGFFDESMRGDYPAMAERARSFLGYSTIYEYGAHEMWCHLSEVNPSGTFVKYYPSIYE